MPDHGWYYSVETTANHDGSDVVITGIALVSATAQVGLSPVHVLAGDLDDYRHRDKRRGLSHVASTILAHAAEHHEHHRHATPTTLEVHDLKPPQLLHGGAGWVDAHGDLIPANTRAGERIAYDDDGRPLGPLWIRPSVITSVGGLPPRPR